MVVRNRKFNLLDLNPKIEVELNQQFVEIIKNKIKENYILKKVEKEVSYNRHLYLILKRNYTVELGNVLKFIEYTDISKEKINNNVKYLSIGRTGIKVKNVFPIELTSDLSYIVGKIIGDGFINHQYRVGYSNKSELLISKFRDVFNRVFKFDNPNIVLNNHGITSLWYPSIYGHLLHSLFGVFAFKRREKFIPEQIMSENKTVKASLLGALFEDEGSVSKSAKQINIATSSEVLVHQIKTLFQDLNISSGINKKMKKPSNFANFKKSNYIVYVGGYNNLKRFYDLCSWKQVKWLKLGDLLDSTNPNLGNKYKEGEAKSKIIEILKSKEATTREICDELGIHYGVAHKHLNELEKEYGLCKERVKPESTRDEHGRIKKLKKQRGTKWSLIDTQGGRTSRKRTQKHSHIHN